MAHPNMNRRNRHSHNAGAPCHLTTEDVDMLGDSELELEPANWRQMNATRQVNIDIDDGDVSTASADSDEVMSDQVQPRREAILQDMEMPDPFATSEQAEIDEGDISTATPDSEEMLLYQPTLRGAITSAQRNKSLDESSAVEEQGQIGRSQTRTRTRTVANENNVSPEDESTASEDSDHPPTHAELVVGDDRLSQGDLHLANPNGVSPQRVILNDLDIFSEKEFKDHNGDTPFQQMRDGETVEQFIQRVPISNIAPNDMTIIWVKNPDRIGFRSKTEDGLWDDFHYLTRRWCEDPDSDEEFNTSDDTVMWYDSERAQMSTKTRASKLRYDIMTNGILRCITEGKWLVFLKRIPTNDMWIRLVRATRNGRLGRGMTLQRSTYSGTEFLLAFETDVITDRPKIEHVMHRLNRLGLFEECSMNGAARYKPAILSKLKINHRNPWFIRTSIVSARKMNGRIVFKWNVKHSEYHYGEQVYYTGKLPAAPFPKVHRARVRQWLNDLSSDGSDA